MKKYATYKQSGIEWLGEIPEHWEVKRLKYVSQILFSNVDKKTHENDKEVLLCNYVDVYKNDIIDESIDFMKATANENEIEKFRIEKGDVLVTKDSESPDDIAVPAFVNSNFENVLCGYHLAIIKGKTIDKKYLYRLFCSSAFNYQFMIASNGITRFGLGQRVFSNAIVPVIPIEEQTAIANYLDERIAKLDKLLKNKEDQIEKLKEIRQIEINTAVTKGLNPKAKMINSGIDWLGEIPAEWEVERIKNVCEVNPKKCDSGFSSDSTMPVVFLPMESVSESGEFDDSVRIPINELWSGFTYFKRGDIVLAKITPCFENGKCACLDHLSTEIGFGTTEFHVLRPSSKRVFNRFIYYITKSEMFMQFGKALMTGAAGQKRVPTEFIQTFKIAVPGIKEQIQITDYLDERISIIDRLILNFVYEIEKLKEIRKIEIYNAVTGKIKVV